jgi:hypothetical protein
LLFELVPESGGNLGLQLIPVFLNLPIASRSDDQRDGDVRCCRELQRSGPQIDAKTIGDRLLRFSSTVAGIL